ncbi:UNVERIFIED_CONTAM: hypothetical protein O8I53_07730 [Campylobacter lari]
MNKYKRTNDYEAINKLLVDINKDTYKKKILELSYINKPDVIQNAFKTIDSLSGILYARV